MPGYTCNGEDVEIPYFADIPNEFRPNGLWSELVQKTLDGVEPWGKGEDPIETDLYYDVEGLIFPMAIEVTENDQITWGIHAGHKTKNGRPGLSPFIQKYVPKDLCKAITVELTRDSENPMLARAYGGEYTPPLPWMGSASKAPGGRKACIEYWRTHAYRTYFGCRLIRARTQTIIAPDWYTH